MPGAYAAFHILSSNHAENRPFNPINLTTVVKITAPHNLHRTVTQIATSHVIIFLIVNIEERYDMADVSEVNEVKPAEKYKSTKLLSGVGGFEIGGLIGTVASLPFGLSALKDVMKSHDASEGITRGDRTKFLVKLSTLLVLPLVGGIIGAVTGYRRGKKAEEQYNSVSKDLAISQAQVGHLTNTISEKDTQLAASEKRFTDVISSRQHHGGHAGAVHADAAQAAEMEMAR